MIIGHQFCSRSVTVTAKSFHVQHWKVTLSSIHHQTWIDAICSFKKISPQFKSLQNLFCHFFFTAEFCPRYCKVTNKAFSHEKSNICPHTASLFCAILRWYLPVSCNTWYHIDMKCKAGKRILVPYANRNILLWKQGQNKS